MSEFDAVALPESPAEHGRERARASIIAWIQSPPLRRLVETFGGEIPNADITTALRWVDEFSAQRWDYRRGKERNLAASEDFDADTERLILNAARALGLMAGRSPRFARYDHMLILGGLVRACVLRPRLARDLLDDGLQVGEITALGAFRALGGDEHDLARAGGLDGVEDEVHAMEAGVRAALSLGEPASVRGDEHAENTNLRWRLAEYESTPPVTVVAAPTSDPERRANTPDTYTYWAQHVARLAERPGSHVLLVTSAIYVPFQHADAIRMLSLPYGAIVDTIGVDRKQVNDEALRQRFAPTSYLQEVRSAIRALGNLNRALDDG
jgi:hypothetical protein